MLSRYPAAIFSTVSKLNMRPVFFGITHFSGAIRRVRTCHPSRLPKLTRIHWRAPILGTVVHFGQVLGEYSVQLNLTATLQRCRQLINAFPFNGNQRYPFT